MKIHGTFYLSILVCLFKNSKSLTISKAIKCNENNFCLINAQLKIIA